MLKESHNDAIAWKSFTYYWPFAWNLLATAGFPSHYNDVIMGTIASQITSVSIVYLIVSTGTDQIKHQSSASLALVRSPVNSPHKWPVTRRMFPFDDVLWPRPSNVELWCFSLLLNWTNCWLQTKKIKWPVFWDVLTIVLSMIWDAVTFMLSNGYDIWMFNYRTHCCLWHLAGCRQVNPTAPSDGRFHDTGIIWLSNHYVRMTIDVVLA